MWRFSPKCFVNEVRHVQFKFSPFATTRKESQKAGLQDAFLPNLLEKEVFNCYQYFTPVIKSAKPFSLILPPPNITGTLHLGHALTATIQDVIVRWKRMEGVECVWIPGIDHAGIATQVVVEKKLWKEKGQSRHDIGRKAFQERVWEWKEEKAGVIENQLERLGASLDWTRKVFTMDPVQSLAVTRAFIKLFESGLIYRADHLVNWSCCLQSAISDIEVEHIEVDGPTLIRVPNYEKPIEFGTLTLFAYKIHNSDEEIVVATTRPETMLGDVAVAVNPCDDRYARHIGRYLWHPFRNETIPIIGDDFVDPDFGSGAVKVTPAHDPSDFAVSKRHSLPILHVIDERGNFTPNCGDLSGMPRFTGRAALLSRLEASDLLRGTQGHKMVVPVCSRSKDIIEHLVRPQWFIKCSEMAEEAVKDVKEGRLRLDPKHFERVWFDYLENSRDWCISRQLWWGHRIPVYSCRPRDTSTPAIWIAAESPSQALQKASSQLSTTDMEIEQDNDVLDTWFSSALLPFTAWSQQDQAADKHYPLDIMVTGHDIVFFWVARMVMLGKTLTGRLPFDRVLLHGIICDSHGRKMSKSLGNVVTPEDVIDGVSLENLAAASRSSHDSGILSSEELTKALAGQKKMFPAGIPECGADALRFTLCSHNIKSHFINFDVQECHTNRLFCNKVWQATKYVNGVMERTPSEWFQPIQFQNLVPMDRWVLSRLTHMVNTCRNSLEEHDFHVATDAIKDFLYFQFCDVYLETTKRAFRLEERENAAGHCWTLTTCLETAMRAAAPFMPRLMQHLHERLKTYPGAEKSLEYPQGLPWRDTSLENDVSRVLEVVVGIRRLKKTFGVVGKHNPEVILIESSSFYDPFKTTIGDLSAVHKLTITPEIGELSLKDTVSDRVSDTLIHLVVHPDLRKSLELDLPKLEAKKAKLIKEMEKLNRMISGVNYKVKATEEAQRTHAKKIATLEEKLARINYIQSVSRQ